MMGGLLVDATPPMSHLDQFVAGCRPSQARM